jgi:hypothetical protein
MYTPGPATNLATSVLGFRQNEHEAITLLAPAFVQPPFERHRVKAGLGNIAECQSAPAHCVGDDRVELGNNLAVDAAGDDDLAAWTDAADRAAFAHL